MAQCQKQDSQKISKSNKINQKKIRHSSKLLPKTYKKYDIKDLMPLYLFNLQLVTSMTKARIYMPIKKSSKPAKGSELAVLHEILLQKDALGGMDKIVKLITNWYKLKDESYESPVIPAHRRALIKNKLLENGEKGAIWWNEFEKKTQSIPQEIDIREIDNLRIQNAVLKSQQNKEVQALREDIKSLRNDVKEMNKIWTKL